MSGFFENRAIEKTARIMSYMLIIAKKYMEFGMDFLYENNGSDGEVITSLESCTQVVDQYGKLYFEYEGQVSEYDNNGFNRMAVLDQLEKSLIKETS